MVVQNTLLDFYLVKTENVANTKHATIWNAANALANYSKLYKLRKTLIIARDEIWRWLLQNSDVKNSLQQTNT